MARIGNSTDHDSPGRVEYFRRGDALVMPIDPSTGGIILGSSLTLSAILVALIGVLLSQYESAKRGPDYASRPYLHLLVGMLGVLVWGAIVSILTLTYIVVPQPTQLMSNAVFLSFVILILSVVVVVVLVTTTLILAK